MKRLVVLALSLALVAAPASADADRDIASANSHLKRAEANLQLVDGSIGHLTRPPKGSAAKLSKMRLDQALGDIQPAGKLLGGLKSGTGLAEAIKRYNAAVALHTKLAAILTGKPPEPKPEPEPDQGQDETKEEATDETPGDEPASQTVRLGYPHADNFKNALFTLRRVESDAAALVQALEEARAVEDPLTINHRHSATTMANVVETRRQAGFAETALAAIPANGEGVAEAKQRLVNARAQVDTVELFFKPLDARLQDLVHPGNYPEHSSDVKRLRELGSTYGNPQYLFRDQRSLAAELLSQGDAAQAECQRIAQLYARLMQQGTEQGKQVEIAGNNFLRQHEAFRAEAERQRAGLPADIRADLKEADRMAGEAVANQKPLWFTGGIPQRMEWVADKLTLYRALDPAGAEPLTQEVERMRASLAERADSLRELIIRENPLPSDRFTGADRDAAVAVAVDAWRHQEADFELLAVRIPSEAWSRETKWTYSNGTWYFVDRSTLQVRLIVADRSNPELAIDRPVNVRKDHQKGDTLIGVPMRSFDEALQPSEYLLRSRIR